MDKMSVLTDIRSPLLTLLSTKLLRSLAVIGGLYVAFQFQAFTSWTWYHLLRSGNIQKYKSKDNETWAIVTGASAGIGKGFVQELASQGFNVVLHGRNEAKLAKFQAELQAQYPQAKFRLLILDAADVDLSAMEAAATEIKALNVRILINNVAGGGQHEKPIFEALQNKTAENIDGWMNITARFPVHFTRLVLPMLIDKPSSLIINIGSGAAELAVPYLAVYSGLKAFNKVWSQSLTSELQADGNSHVEVLAVTVGQTSTERMRRGPTAMIPSSRQMAQSSLSATGCGKPVITAYWGHALQDAIMAWLPTSFARKQILSLARTMKADERAGRAF